MKFKRTIFSTEINGVKYKFAERTLREVESLVERETSAFEAKDFAKVKEIHYEFVCNAMVDGGEEVSVDDLHDAGGPTFNALYMAILASQGIKLEAKTGELAASQSS